jgi:hypothetical protein
VLSVLGSCSSGADHEAVPVTTVTSEDTNAIAPAWAAAPRDSNLTCTPATLGAADTLRMRMTLPHGASFHVADPAGMPFIVVFHGEGDRDRAQRRSLMPPDSFAKVTTLDVQPRTFRAGVWVFGRDTNELVFTRAGTYRLRVGSDMETDGPIYAECLVRYRP